MNETLECVVEAVKNRSLTREEYKAVHSLCREYGIGKRSFDLTKSLNRAIYSDELAERENIVLCKSEKDRVAILKPRMILRAARQEGRRRRRASFQRLAQKGRV